MTSATAHEQLTIRCLLDELGINARHVTGELLPFAQRAGIRDWLAGERLDKALRTTTREQAQALEAALLEPVTLA